MHLEASPGNGVCFGTVGVVPPIISPTGAVLVFALCSLEPESGEALAAWTQHQT